MGAYFHFYIKTYIKILYKGDTFCFSKNYSAVVINTYWALKKGDIVNMIYLNMMYLRNIRVTYFKHFQNRVSKTSISSAAQQSTT